MRNNILVLLTLLFIFSCGVKKEIRYFENIDKSNIISGLTVPPFVFQPNDLIKIRISSKDNFGVAPFNLTETSFILGTGMGTSTEVVRPYLVQSDGTIDMPTLGKVEVVNKSREQLSRDILEMLEPYLKNEPRVDIEMVNFKISVLGDVGSPGVYPIENERVSILDALAMAGDLNTSARRDSLWVLRETNGEKKFIGLNLLNKSLFGSEAYYLVQNDMVYAVPNALKTREGGWESRLPIFTSLIALSLTIYSILLR